MSLFCHLNTIVKSLSIIPEEKKRKKEGGGAGETRKRGSKH